MCLSVFHFFYFLPFSTSISLSLLMSQCVWQCVSQSLCQSVNLLIYISVCLTLYLSACQPVCPSVNMYFNMSDRMSVYLSLSLCVNLSMCQSVNESILFVCWSTCMLVFLFVNLSVYLYKCRLCRFLPINESAFLSISKSIILCVCIFFLYVCLQNICIFNNFLLHLCQPVFLSLY